jgi:hypothetical protein
MQQGQGFELKKRAVDGRAVWAYRYRTDGPGQTVTAGGFSSEGDAAEALDNPQRRRSEKRPFQSWAHSMSSPRRSGRATGRRYSSRPRPDCGPARGLSGPEEPGTRPQDLSPNRSLPGKRLVGAVVRRVVAP